MIAAVIVDIPAMQTDHPFDYMIPEKWEKIIFPGMRVIVPFGPRKVQGFVIELKEESTFSSLKPIHSILDVTPVLNKELLELGFWLTESTLCFAISAFQAMLPAAMKVKYEKEIHLTTDFHNIDVGIQHLFKNKPLVTWKEIEESSSLQIFQKEIQKGHLEVFYKITDRARRKMVKSVALNVDQEELAQLMADLPVKSGKQRGILEYFSNHPEPIPLSQLAAMLNITISPIKTLIKKNILMEIEQEVYRDPFLDKSFEKTKSLPLSSDQQKALDPILESIEMGVHETLLLYGVTGSGKTEVYLQAIESVLKKGKEAIVLVPEISLTPQMVKRFKGRFGSLVAVLHSGLAIGEKYDEWRKIQRKEVSVVVGARSAIFAPFENLGIIIMDEEHETSYKQEENPRYHAKDVAIKRGSSHSCPVVLGSATPSLESFARAKKGVFKQLTLQKRINDQALPSVDIIDMREEMRNGNRTMFSGKLLEKLKERMEKGEQSVLFLNKRGHSSFVMCRDCGFVVNCPHCDISLTYHRMNHLLKCHYCGYEQPAVRTCPDCGSEHIRFFGTGTQKVEEEITKVMPEARVIRMDVDTTRRKGAHEKLLTAFEEKKADILLGTQMIAKGLDIPNVTLVGVLAADTMLHLPDFRASEKTFQLLTQVSGRAGRHKLAGEVIIQSYTPDHYSVVLASMHDFDSFYQKEMMLRKMSGYPPFYYLALVSVSHPDLQKVVEITEKITNFIRSRLSSSSVILGPVASVIPRINDRYRYQCMIKYKRETNLSDTLKSVVDHYQQEITQNQLSISIDLNPYMMM